MNPQWQQQQEQLRRMQQQQQENMRRQQEEIRKRQEMGQWYQKQQEKGKPQMTAGGPAAGKFAQVKAEATRLKEEVVAGRLTNDQFKAKLRELMFTDKDGVWWMLGAETLEWYSSRGTDWARADPPADTELKVGLPDSKQSLAGGARHAPRIVAIIVLLASLAATVFAGLAAGFLTERLSGNGVLSTVVAVLVWSAGVALSIIITRKMWRRRQPSP